MTYLLIGFLIVILAPLFMPTWRTNIWGLALQGFLLTWMAVKHTSVDSASGVILVADLFMVRTVLAPRLLYRTLAAQHASQRGAIVPLGLFSWALIGVIIFAGFHFAGNVLSVNAPEYRHLAIVTIGIMLGMLVLATQRSLMSQASGLLRIENAIVLFELMSPHHFPALIQFGVSAVFLLTVLLFNHFLRDESQNVPDAHLGDVRPTL
jgi:hydrogenase-4 membrane subunit HyfE